MSIYSDTLPDDEYQFLARRENRRDRIEREELEDEWEDDDGYWNDRN